MSSDTSKEMALTLVRGTLAITVAGALACLAASTQLPFFRLNVESLHSSIEQSLWYTHVRTPIGYQDVRVTDFWKCEELVSAFKGAQAATFLGIVFASLGFLFAIFNGASSFTHSVQRVRWVCGAPLLVFVFLALLAQLVTLAIASAMYSRDWCTSSSDDSAPQASDETCDPFKGCIHSFEKMGFATHTGYQTACASSILLTIAIFCELVVCAFGGFDDSDEGGEPAVALLTSRNRPNNGEAANAEGGAEEAPERLV